MSRVLRRALILVSAMTLVMGLPLTASASHSWGDYHWARTANPFTLKLGDNVTTAAWHDSLAASSTDWSQSNVLDTTVVAGESRSVKLCDAKTGKVQVCNGKYGNNGWLGIASIWASGSHITKGTVKVNDTYFNTASYNTPAWRNLVMCQEVGHTLGLGHQNDTFNTTNLGTCMDYTSDPDGPPDNQHPNAHDYEQLTSIYEHTTDSTTTVAATTTAAPGASGADIADGAWGRLVQVTNNGQGAWFERDLGAGDRILTHVLWAD